MSTSEDTTTPEGPESAAAVVAREKAAQSARLAEQHFGPATAYPFDHEPTLAVIYDEAYDRAHADGWEAIAEEYASLARVARAAYVLGLTSGRSGA